MRTKKNQSAFAKSKHIQNKNIQGLESIAGSGLRNGEQIALMKPAITETKNWPRNSGAHCKNRKQ